MKKENIFFANLKKHRAVRKIVVYRNDIIGLEFAFKALFNTKLCCVAVSGSVGLWIHIKPKAALFTPYFTSAIQDFKHLPCQ